MVFRVFSQYLCYTSSIYFRFYYFLFLLYLTQVVAACEDDSVRIIDPDSVEVSVEIQVLSG